MFYFKMDSAAKEKMDVHPNRKKPKKRTKALLKQIRSQVCLLSHLSTQVDS